MHEGTGLIGEQQREAMRRELEALEEGLRPGDRWVFACILLVAFACLAVITPYRDVRIAPAFMFAVGICLVALLFPLIMERHEILVLMLVTYLPFSKVVPGKFGGFARTFNATNILLCLAVIGWIIAASMGRQHFYQREKPDLPLLLFLFLACISLVRGFTFTEGRDPVDVSFAMKRWVTPMLIYFLVANNMRSIRQIILTFYAFCLTTGAIALLCMKKFYVDLGPRSSMEKSRLGVTSGPNHLGFLMCSCVFLLLVLWLAKRRRKIYWLLWIPILACVQAMRLTYSRGAQVGLIAGILTLLFCTSRRWFIGACVLLGLCILYPDMVPRSVAGRLGTTVTGTEGALEQRLDRSSSDRLRIWRGGIRMIADHPLLGVGYGNFRRRIGHYPPGLSGRDAHNTYLIVAAEMGVPALLLFIAFFYIVGRSAWQIHRAARTDPELRMVTLAFLAMLGATLVANLFGTRFDSVEVTVQVYGMAGLMASVQRLLDYRRQLA